MIPNILHQVFVNSESLSLIPRYWQQLSKKARKLHPEWDYMLWDNEKLVELCKAHYPHLLKYFEADIPAVIQSDIGRYLVLKHYGGWYFDFDYEIFRSLEVWNSYSLILPLERSVEDGCEEGDQIGNSILASEAQHWFWNNVLDSLPNTETFKHELTHETIMETTGPLKITNLYNQLKKKEQENIYCSPRRIFHYPMPQMMRHKEYKTIKAMPTVFGLHYTHSSWRDHDLLKNIKRRKYAQHGLTRFLQKKWGQFKKRKNE